MLQIGFNIPMAGPLMAPENLVRLATEGEAMGYDYLTFGDHVIIPRDIHAKYPYSTSGEFPAGQRGDRHEQLTTIAYLAGCTSRIKMVTSIMVVGHRPAVLTAKMLANIDIMSQGRLRIGVGAGWLKEEMEALNGPPFQERGKAMDEYLLAFKELWTNENPKFEGKYVAFDDLIFGPKPFTKPHPPIWIGGESPPALRRAAQIGNGWMPISTNPERPLDTKARYAAALSQLGELADAQGRALSDITLCYRVQGHGAAAPETANDGDHRLFGGSDAQIIDDLGTLAEMGVEYVDFGFGGATIDEVIDGLARFNENVLSKIPGLRGEKK